MTTSKGATSDTDEGGRAIVATKSPARRKPTRTKARGNGVTLLRIAVISCIFAAAAVVGYFSYEVLRAYEYDEFIQEYKVLIDKLIPATTAGILRTIMAVKTATRILGDFYPNNTSWPNAVYDNFPVLADSLLPLSGSSSMSFQPLVRPADVASFEAFAYAYYARHPEWYPPNVATSNFGRGIWAIDPDSKFPDKKFHDVTGIQPNSSYVYLAPTLQAAFANRPTQTVANRGLMVNTRGVDYLCANAQDRILDCAASRKHLNETCAMITTMPSTDDARRNPRTLVFEPVFAANDQRSVVGFVMATVFLGELLKPKLDRSINGIVFVMRVHELVLTYQIQDGNVVFKGTGDLHDPGDDKYARSLDLLKGVDGVAHCLTMSYEITFYATKAYQAEYRSQFRWIFCFGSVGIIFFVSLVFMAYDGVMMRLTSEQQAVLDTKRQFVRFISHEVRTPLNAVSMASDLLRDQVMDTISRARESSSERTRRLTESPSLNTQTLEDSLDLCEEIIGNTRNAVEVLDDLLNYDKIEVGGLVLEPSFVALDHILDLVMKPFSGPARKKEVKMEVDIASFQQHAVFQGGVHGGKFSALRVVGDKVRLQQVIRNLVSNALKFTSAMGKIKVSLVWVENGLPNAKLAPELSDTLLTASALSSTRRADNSFTSITLNSLRSWSSTDSKSAVATKKIVAAPSDASSSEFSAIDDPDATYDGAGSAGHSIDSGSVPSTSRIDKNVAENTSVDFSRAKVLRGSYTRAPKDVNTCRRYGSVRLTVTDDGAGLSPEQLQRVCSEGVQFNANELQAGQGSGLGLYIAKGIVIQHGGTLNVESAGLRKGSSFIVELPLFACDIFSPWENRVLAQAQRAGSTSSSDSATGVLGARPNFTGVLDRVVESDSSGRSVHHSGREESNNELTPATVLQSMSVKFSEKQSRVVPAPIPERSTSAASLKCTKRCVLVVDDVPSNLKMATRLLKHRGVESCVQAENGQLAIDTYLAARAALQEQATHAVELHCIEEGGESSDATAIRTPPNTTEPFDAILMDYEMPVMNGPTATTKLRELGCKVPIIGISGNVLPGDVRVFMDSGATAVLPKPLNFEDLETAWNR